jgi:small GTP-binding protein
MLGAFSVGKTSLVNQFVSSIFNEKYHTTIGVKISKKVITTPTESVQLMIWDIEGTDIFTDLKSSYLKGASGIILVIDGTRHASLEEALKIKSTVNTVLGDVAMVCLINKHDLTNQWVFEQSSFDSLKSELWQPFRTSAKTGQNVELAFTTLVNSMLETVQ